MARRRSHRRSRRRGGHRYPRRGGGHITYRRNPPGLARLFGGKMLGGFVDTHQLTTGAIVAGGILSTTWLLAKLDKSNKLQGWARIGAKAGVGILAGMALKMAKVPTSIAAGVALGGIVAAFLDSYNKVTPPGGMKGLGWFGVDAPDSGMYPSEVQALGSMDAGGLPEGTIVTTPDGRTLQVVAEQ